MKNLAILLFALHTSVAGADFIDNTVTVDFAAEAPDKVLWQGLDVETGRTLAEPRLSAPNWHLRLRQGYVSTNVGSAAKLENVAFEAVKEAPSLTLFSADDHYDPMGPAPSDTYNKKLMDWYEYFMFQGHLLAPSAYLFVVRTHDDHFMKVQFLDYIKNGMAIRSVKDTDLFGRTRTKKRAVKVGPEDGLVHVKLRYKYNTEAGSSRLE